MSDKPNVLILGGLGFIGRNLVEYLYDNKLVGIIRVADKQIPELVGLSAKQNELLKNTGSIQFRQCNLARESMIDKAFADVKFDFVFNLAGETKYSQTDEVYNENIIEVSVKCAKAAANHGVKRFIEVSTSQVYDPDKKPRTETDKIKPWTKLAVAKYSAEEELRKIPGLNLIIVRPAIVYGPGDILGLTPRIICGAVYKHLDEKMEFLWDDDLLINTVHVKDVAAALWHLTQSGTVGEVYNLADSNSTCQGTVANLLTEIFGIKTSFKGYLFSKGVTSVAMKTVAETANEKHLSPWSDLCKTKSIVTTPLTPYLDEELLYNHHTSVDGSKITLTGFSYKYSTVTKDSLVETIQYFVDLGFFPKEYI